MPTTIVPSLGQGAAFTQQGPGTTPGYSAIDLRRADSAGLQEGVVNASDFMVVQRAAGANLSVDIGMPAGCSALVQGDSVNGQGLYTVAGHSATVNEPVAAADGTNPRIDSVILEVFDNTHDASGLNLARVRVITGTPNSTATLDNRAGAPTLPGSALLLADLRVAALATTVPNTVIRDRRKWARGIGKAFQTTATSATPQTEITGSAFRYECSGVVVEVAFTGGLRHATVNTLARMRLQIDGSNTGPAVDIYTPVAGNNFNAGGTFSLTPSPGSHVLRLTIEAAAGTATSDPLSVAVRERVQQDTANNTTTSG